MFGSNLLTGWLPGRWPHLNEKRPIYLLSTGVEKIIEKKKFLLDSKVSLANNLITKWANGIVSIALIRKEQGK